MILYEAEHIRDSQGNQWNKTELKGWCSAHQRFQVCLRHLKELLKLGIEEIVNASHRDTSPSNLSAL